MIIDVIREWSCSLADICTCSFFPAFHLLWSLWAAPVRFPRSVELFDAPGPWDVLAVLPAEPPPSTAEVLGLFLPACNFSTCPWADRNLLRHSTRQAPPRDSSVKKTLSSSRGGDAPLHLCDSSWLTWVIKWSPGAFRFPEC